MCTLVGSNPCRRFSLLGFAHPVVESPFQVQDMRVGHDFVLFCFWLVLYSSRTKTRTPFLYQRDCKETVIIVYHIFFLYYELNKQEWVSIYETCECDFGAPDIHSFLRVDGLSTGLPGFGASHLPY